MAAQGKRRIRVSESKATPWVTNGKSSTSPNGAPGPIAHRFPSPLQGEARMFDPYYRRVAPSFLTYVRPGIFRGIVSGRRTLMGIRQRKRKTSYSDGKSALGRPAENRNPPRGQTLRFCSAGGIPEFPDTAYATGGRKGFRRGQATGNRRQLHDTPLTHSPLHHSQPLFRLLPTDILSGAT
jgi:hypothetical protein